MADKKFKIGIIGAGMIAEKHITSFQKTGEAEVTWLAELKESLLKAVAQKYAVPNATNDYLTLLESDVDAVVICTPPKTHVNIFLDCLNAGKHVLLEKPAAITREEAKVMLEARKKHPELIVCEASCRHARLQPKFRTVKAIIDSGRLGDIYYIHHNSAFRQGRGGIEYHPTAKWFLSKAIAGGGPMLDWGVYDLSFHLGLLNDVPELESAHTLFLRSGLDKVDPGTDVYDVEEHGASLLTFSGGLRFYWERAAQANVDVPNETRIYGTKGGLRFAFCSWDAPEIEFFDVADEGRGQARKEVIVTDMSAHINDEYELARHYIDVLKGKAEPMMPLERALKHLDIIFSVYEGASLQK